MHMYCETIIVIKLTNISITYLTFPVRALEIYALSECQVHGVINHNPRAIH